MPTQILAKRFIAPVHPPEEIDPNQGVSQGFSVATKHARTGGGGGSDQSHRTDRARQKKKDKKKNDKKKKTTKTALPPRGVSIPVSEALTRPTPDSKPTTRVLRTTVYAKKNKGVFSLLLSLSACLPGLSHTQRFVNDRLAVLREKSEGSVERK